MEVTPVPILRDLTPPPRVVRSRLSTSSAALEGVHVRVADTPKEIEDAARALHDVYQHKGLIDPHASGVWAAPAWLLPQTLTVIATRGNEIVGTLSLLLDSPLGLPLEAVFPRQVGGLRALGRPVVEAGALCVIPRERCLGISFLMSKLAFLCCAQRYRDGGDVLIAVHPREAPAYASALLFETVGSVRGYPGLHANGLAVAMHLPTERFASMPRRFRTLPDKRIALPDDGHLARSASARRVAAARLVARRPDLIAGLSDEARAYFRQEVPLGSDV